jgi:hypothetical protein
MLRRSLAVAFTSVLIGLISATAHAQTEHPTERAEPTKYEKFLMRSDELIVTKSYAIGKLPGGGGLDVSVRVAWALGETEKVYAASVGGRIVDFEHLQGMLDGMDQMTQAIGSLFDKLEATSMRYTSPAGLRVTYYIYNDPSGTPRRHLYLVAGSYVSQGPTTEPLVETRDLVAQARAKLVSLGAQ